MKYVNLVTEEGLECNPWWLLGDNRTSSHLYSLAFLVAATKTPHLDHQKVEGFILSNSFRGVTSSWQRSHAGTEKYRFSWFSRQSKHPSSFFLLAIFSIHTQSHRITTLRFRTVLPVSAHPFWKCLHRQTQRGISPVFKRMIDWVKLAVKMSHQGHCYLSSFLCQNFSSYDPLIIPLHNQFHSNERTESDFGDELQ